MRRIGTITALGAGAAAAGWYLARNRRAHSQPEEPRAGRPHIVVAGAGFAGIGTLQALARHLPPGAADVTLIDRHNYHLFTPLLYQVATGAVDSTNLTYPLRRFCATKGFNFLSSHIYGINAVDQVITTAAGQVPYDYLVLGLGAQTNYFGMDEVQQHSYALKTVPDATRLRREIVRKFELAAQTEDPDERRYMLTFIVVGGGATGIELTGSMHDLIVHNMLRYYPEISRDEVRLILLEAADRILPGINERIAGLALDRFEELGIEVKLNTLVAGVRNRAVVTRDGDRIPGDIIVWTAGIRPSPISASLAVEKTRDGRIAVDEHLRIPSIPNIFALGDNAAVTDLSSGNTLPPNAAVAVQEGAATGENIARLVRDEPLMPFRYNPMGELIALGRLRAAAELGPFVFNGLLAWLIWRVVYLTKLMGTRNRAGLVIDWIASLFAQRQIVDTELVE